MHAEALPIVQIVTASPGVEAPYVGIDNYAAGRMAGLLISLGCSRVPKNLIAFCHSASIYQLLPVILRLKDQGPKTEFFEQLLRPLLPKRRRDDQEDTTLMLGTALRDDEARLDGLPEPDLVGEDRALRDRRLQCEQGRIDLMRIHLDASGRRGLCERIVAHPFERDPMGKKLALVGQQF